MDIFEIYIAFISWGSGGKRRPVLILEENACYATVLKITTCYENKSENIRAKYFIIGDWNQAGLTGQSYIGTNQTITLPLSAIDRKKPIGRLSKADEIRLIEFIV